MSVSSAVQIHAVKKPSTIIVFLWVASVQFNLVASEHMWEASVEKLIKFTTHIENILS